MFLAIDEVCNLPLCRVFGTPTNDCDLVCNSMKGIKHEVDQWTIVDQRK
jgi:hypothetical protein